MAWHGMAWQGMQDEGWDAEEHMTRSSDPCQAYWNGLEALKLVRLRLRHTCVHACMHAHAQGQCGWFVW